MGLALPYCDGRYRILRHSGYPLVTLFDRRNKGRALANLTKRLIDSLGAPAEDDLFAWDDKLKGFGVRVKPSGMKSYVIKYRTRQGVSRRFTFARHGEVTAEEARKKAAAMLAEIRLGADPAGERREQRRAATVAELIDTYLAEAPASRPNKRPSSWERDRSCLHRHARPFARNEVDAVAHSRRR